jgi:nucleoid-associated protein YgaU
VLAGRAALGDPRANMKTTKLAIAVAASLSLATPVLACPIESHDAARTAEKSDQKPTEAKETAKADPAKPAPKAKAAKPAEKAKPGDKVSQR